MRVILTEKPSVAKEIAKTLGLNKINSGYISGNDTAICWAFGHLIQLAPPQHYGFNSWTAESLPMIPNPFKLIPKQIKDKDKMIEDPGVVKQLKIIEELFNQADEIIVATDAGREGELIFRYIYQFLKCKKPFKRLWVSSQTEEAILNGFKNLKSGKDYDSLFSSAQSRSESDWIVGLNATRALSIASQNNKTLSLGRVQTPTLALICARFLENKNFKPQKYYQLKIIMKKDNIIFSALATQNFNDKAKATAIFEEIPKTIKVISINTSEKKETPPLLFDLGSLQQEANKKHGFTAEETLNIAQKLYESKFISYPRTGSRYIGDDVFHTVNNLIENLKEDKDFGQYAKTLINKSLNKKSVNSAKVTDHHALLPTETKINFQKTGTEETKIYRMIAGRMLEAFSPECIKNITKVSFSANLEFQTTGTIIISKGWRSVFNDKESQDEENQDQENQNNQLPKLNVDEILNINDKQFLEKETKPKPLFNEASLLKAMESAGKEIEDEELRQTLKDIGIGTPATRANIIETIIKRKYVNREKKQLIPTPLGLSVFEIVKEKSIASAELTGQWEKKLENITKGASATTFKTEIIEYTTKITKELLNSQITINEQQDKINCPLCKTGSVKIGEKAAGCSEYKTGCAFVIWREKAGKKLTDKQLISLIKTGKTELIKGFKNKEGKTFNASLKFENNKISFEFKGKT